MQKVLKNILKRHVRSPLKSVVCQPSGCVFREIGSPPVLQLNSSADNIRQIFVVFHFQYDRTAHIRRHQNQIRIEKIQAQEVASDLFDLL